VAPDSSYFGLDKDKSLLEDSKALVSRDFP